MHKIFFFVYIASFGATHLCHLSANRPLTFSIKNIDIEILMKSCDSQNFTTSVFTRYKKVARREWMKSCRSIQLFWFVFCHYTWFSLDCKRIFPLPIMSPAHYARVKMHRVSREEKYKRWVELKTHLFCSLRSLCSHVWKQFAIISYKYCFVQVISSL